MKTGPIRLLLIAALSAGASAGDETGRADPRSAKVKPSPAPKSAPRERTAKDSPHRSEPDHKAQLRKARALANEVERIIGMPLALSEKDPKELATEIKAMEVFLADHRKAAQTRAIPRDRTERSASEQWWRSQQAERATVQQRQSEIEQSRMQRESEDRLRRQRDEEFRRR